MRSWNGRSRRRMRAAEARKSEVQRPAGIPIAVRHARRSSARANRACPAPRCQRPRDRAPPYGETLREREGGGRSILATHGDLPEAQELLVRARSAREREGRRRTGNCRGHRGPWIVTTVAVRRRGWYTAASRPGFGRCTNEKCSARSSLTLNSGKVINLP